jgi:hypothetical protein
MMCVFMMVKVKLDINESVMNEVLLQDLYNKRCAAPKTPFFPPFTPASYAERVYNMNVRKSK